MGIAVPSQLFGRQHLILSTMKAFAAAALVAAASAAPEAKPWLGYGAAVVPIDPHATSGELVTIGDAQVPDTTLSVKAAAADHLAAKSLHYGAYGAYGGYALPLAGHLWKRDAEAKPEAEPWLGYGYGLGGLYGGYGLGYAAAPVVAAPAIPLCINGVAPLGHGLCKRDAEAEPEAFHGYAGLGYGYGGYHYALAAPSTGSPVAGLVANPWTGTVTPPLTPAVAAATADHIATKYGKRSADAYYGYGGYGLGYGYGGYGAGYAYLG